VHLLPHGSPERSQARTAAGSTGNKSRRQIVSLSIMAIYRFLADVTVGAHFAYASFIVLGLIAIGVGGVRGWSWIRNFWFRLVHLLMIGGVALESCFDIECPLTVLENHFRQRGGETTYPGSFVGTLVNDLLFVDTPEWVLSLTYGAIFAVVLLSLLAVPPRRPFRSPRA
jgi:hypothetical protein